MSAPSISQMAAPRWRVLVSAPHAIRVIERYRTELETAGCEIVVAHVRERLEEMELLSMVGTVDGIICGDDRITSRVLDAAPRLRVISKWGTGIDSIDRDAAARRGIAVCNTRNAFSEPVADSVMGYLLLFARQLDRIDADMHAGRWNRYDLVALGECTLGVVGVGNCGTAVIRRAASFGMRILASDPRPIEPSLLAETGLVQMSLDRLLAESDFVTLHTDLNPTSVHLLDERRLAKMRRTAYLVNTSRGPVVDEIALAAALEARQIAGAALDVFADEPLPSTSPLRQLSNVYLAPHTANRSRAAAERVHANTIRNLLHVLDSSDHD